MGFVLLCAACGTETKYEVGGSGKATVKFTGENGPETVKDAPLPWSKTVKVSASKATLSAEGEGMLNCSITVNGAVKGSANTGTCSASSKL